MALRTKSHLTYILSVVISLPCVIQQPTASIIKLIHRYAPESPFHISNLTDREIVEMLNYRSTIHKIRNVTSLDHEVIHNQGTYGARLGPYLVKVSLGKFANTEGSFHKSYYLSLDTTRSIIWMQCEDCKKSSWNHCYPQTEPPFPNSRSSSYQPLQCGKHPLCFPKHCINNLCSYKVTYDRWSHSTGILAYEKFVFPTLTEPENNFQLVFGCGFHNRFTGIEDEVIMAGSFGMGWGPHSFINQTQSTSHGKFSYCLPSTIEGARGLLAVLRYGSDVLPYSTYPGTRLIKYGGHDSYYVNLLDISVNGVRLNIYDTHFKKGEGDDGGCIFDTTTTTITRISSGAYIEVKEAVKRHIARYARSLEITSRRFGYDLCYVARRQFRGQRNLPSITFHFEGDANLVIKPETVFFVTSIGGTLSEYICLSMIPHYKWKTIIGSDLQAERIILYDVSNKKMYFGPQDCSWHN